MVNSEKKKIVFVMPEKSLPVPSIHGGAIENLLTALIDENEKYKRYEFHVLMCKRTVNYELSVLYNKYKHAFFHDYFENRVVYKINGIINAVNKRLNYFVNYFTGYDKYIVDQIKKIQPDYVLYEGSFGTSVKTVDKLLNKNCVMYHIHHCIKPKKRLDRYFGAYICVSNFLKVDWIKSGKIKSDLKYYVLPNCFLSQNFKSLNNTEILEFKKSLGYSENDFICLYTGRIVKEKGIENLINAINKLGEYSDIKLLVVGGNLYKQSHFEKLLHKKASKNIKFVGYIPNNELCKYYAISDLQIIPSLCEEAAGIVALEGRRMGVRQIITNSGGLIEYARKDALVLNKHCDIESQLQSNILKFYEEKKQCDIDKIEQFNTSNYYKNFSKIIEDNYENKRK